MILQLNPPIPVTTPSGKALAHMLVDEGIEHNLLWVCFLDSNGECWTYRNQEIRAQINLTQGREHISPFYDPEDVAFKEEGDFTRNEYKNLYNDNLTDLKQLMYKHHDLQEDYDKLKENFHKLQDILVKVPKQRNEYQEILKNQPGVD